jgi:hypothetical protein
MSSRLAAAILALLLVACSRVPEGPRRVLAEETTLRRQVEGLEALLARAEQGRLLADDGLLVALSEKLVKDVARLALPREQVVAGRWRVRLETVDVRFRDGLGSLRLDGRVSPAERPPEDVFAELALFGLVDSAELLPGGRLRLRGRPIGFEVKRVGVFGESTLGRGLLERLAAERLDELEALAFSVDVPVQVEQALALPGLGGDGPVRVKPASVPLSVHVASVSAFDERLWVALSASAGSWTRAGEAAR